MAVDVYKNTEYYQAGEVVDFGSADGTIVAGIAVSTTSLVCDILLPKKYQSGATLTSTLYGAWIRGNGGQPAATNLPVSCELRGGQTLRLVVTGSGMTNIRAYMANICGTITFG